MQLKWPMLWDLFSLFPAYAGVIPTVENQKKPTETFPRIRGGDPIRLSFRMFIFFFSPHTRG